MLEDVIQRLNVLREKITRAGEYLDLAAKQAGLKQLEEQAAHPDIWNDSQQASELFKKIKQLKALVEPWHECARVAQDGLELAQLMQEDGEDAETLAELAGDVERLEQRLKQLEFQSLLSDETDINNSYLTIHPGAGGTDSCDWAEMLLRMYTRYCEAQGYEVKLLGLQPGDEAGIKSAELQVTGDFAFGYLKAESGVHRLVRLSPFDANNRRHTSFASVFASPEIDDSIDIEILEKDLKIDRFRSSSAGGQHVNVTDSAVRITHLPTGIVVSCQNERSQHQNRDVAMKVLYSRLYLLEQEKLKAETAAREGVKKDIAWGSQIRSYVFHPYNMVKDHRTNHETSSVNNVMNGDLQPFIEAYLRWSAGS
ncbi:peptide chain release factor 2 [Candidatus Sumerlaeota bacterium]